MDVKITGGPLLVEGHATCEGGHGPDLSKTPLLVWVENHPRFGDAVHTEDGKASVEQIVLAHSITPDWVAIAKQFGTTFDHVHQAIFHAGNTIIVP